MSLLSKLKEVKENKADGLIICLAGGNGLGKTPLASIGWRAPILFIQSENGLKHPLLVEKLQKTIFPTGVLSHSDELIQYLEQLNTGPVEFKTVVIDTMTGFSQMYEQEMLFDADELKNEKNKQEAIKKMTVGGANGGFFKTAGMVKNFNTRVANLVRSISKRGITIILLFQTSRLEIRTKDGQPYDVMSLNLVSSGKNDQQMAVDAYTSIADMVFYLDYDVKVMKVGIKGSEYEKASASESNGDYVRYLISGGNVNYHNAKNRLGGENKIEYIVGQNPLLSTVKEYFNSFKQNKEVNENGVN